MSNELIETLNSISDSISELREEMPLCAPDNGHTALAVYVESRDIEAIKDTLRMFNRRFANYEKQFSAISTSLDHLSSTISKASEAVAEALKRAHNG